MLFRSNFFKPILCCSPHLVLTLGTGLLILLTGLLSACSKSSYPPVSSQILVFGTVVNIEVYNTPAAKAEHALAQVKADFKAFHQAWHAWEKGGIVSKINEAIKTQQPIRVAPSVRDFILKSQQLSTQSQGLFDPGIGQLISAWGFHQEPRQGPPPSEDIIQKWLADRPSISDIYFNDLQLNSHNPKVQLDFGGNAKGLAIDMALDTLQQADITNAMVNIGGDMRVIGVKTTHDPTWKIGVQNPKNPKKAIASVALKGGESIVTSGTYQRFYEWQGQRYSHILNPKTGRPANSFASVSVIHPDATTADAAATALLVAGPQNWQRIAQTMQVDMVLAIDHQGKLWRSQALQSRLQDIKP